MFSSKVSAGLCSRECKFQQAGSSDSFPCLFTGWLIIMWLLAMALRVPTGRASARTMPAATPQRLPWTASCTLHKRLPGFSFATKQRRRQEKREMLCCSSPSPFPIDYFASISAAALRRLCEAAASDVLERRNIHYLRNTRQGIAYSVYAQKHFRFQLCLFTNL